MDNIKILYGQNFSLLFFFFILLFLSNPSFASKPTTTNQAEAKINLKQSLPACESQFSKSVCAKIGQMLIVGFGGMKQDENGNILFDDPNGLVFSENANIAKAIRNQYIGGVILFNVTYFDRKTEACLRNRNIINPSQVQKLNQDLQEYSAKVRKQQNMPSLPLFISIDQEGGMVDRLSEKFGFSLKSLIPQALGANEEIALNSQEEKQNALKNTSDYADLMAALLDENHFNLNFFPTVDINLNPLNPVLGGRGRSFSSNPEVVKDQASQFVKSFTNKNIISTLKHFPGHGSSSLDSHEGLVDVTESYIKEKEIYPFQQLILEGYEDIIMSAHVINGQIDKTQCKAGDANDPKTWCPGTLSKATLTSLLREQLGFKGVIISDDMTMGAITNEYPLEIALAKGLNAGIDMFIISNNTEDNTELVVNTFAKLLKEGKISEAELDRANQNISNLKRRVKQK